MDLLLYRRLFVVIILTFPCFVARQVYGSKAAEPKQRNVLFLLADDGGFEMGAYRNRMCQTPNLDNLAKQSLIFNNAFASVSSCSPSRASILTGMPSHQNGMYGLHQGIHHFNAFDSVHSLPTILRENKVTSGLIGKKHVGPSGAFSFDYERTEETMSINQVGRNITRIKNFVREFLAQNGSNPFFLMVSFHDPHRCGDVSPQYGSFCERFGSGEIGMGLIPDWHPIYYQWDELDLPYYVPDTEPARRDIAAQYTTISRLDQGVGLVIKELEAAGHLDDTLIIYTSDNGPPLPAARTNLYDPGVREPMFISSPTHKERRNKVTYFMTSHLDLLPTVLDWYQIQPKSQVNLESNSLEKSALTGKSLLPLLVQEPPDDPDAAVFASQSYHEVTMNYPMRSIRTKRYKLIHNLNFKAPFPIDQDFYVSPTFQVQPHPRHAAKGRSTSSGSTFISLSKFMIETNILYLSQDILNRTINNQPLPWYKTLQRYYNRDEWELYDLKLDGSETMNIASKPAMKEIRTKLEERLNEWLTMTEDPWRCAPHAVLQDKGEFKDNPQCLTLGI